MTDFHHSWDFALNSHCLRVFGCFNNLGFVHRIASCCGFNVEESCHMCLCYQAQSFLSLTRAVKQEDGEKTVVFFAQLLIGSSSSLQAVTCQSLESETKASSRVYLLHGRKLQYNPQKNVIFHFTNTAGLLLFFPKIQTRPLTLKCLWISYIK